jgi:hypothetical protein
MSLFIKFKTSTPTGMQTFEEGIEVWGVEHRFNTAKNFAQRSKRKLYLERDTRNKHDPNAIRVMGKYSHWLFRRKKCIGYVPTDVAKQLVKTELVDKVEARLSMIWLENRSYIGIRFDIVGPENDYKKYCS